MVQGATDVPRDTVSVRRHPWQLVLDWSTCHVCRSGTINYFVMPIREVCMELLVYPGNTTTSFESSAHVGNEPLTLTLAILLRSLEENKMARFRLDL